MATCTAPGQTHIANDCTDSTARNEQADAVLPNLVELLEEFVVRLNVAKLPIVPGIFLQVAIGR